jgi:hypothetical protein
LCLQVVEVRATISSAGAAEDLCQLNHSHAHHATAAAAAAAAVEAPTDEELGSEECEEGMVLYNMLSYAS